MEVATGIHQYLYSFKYDRHHQDLSQLESRQLFGVGQEDRTVFTDIELHPSISAFIKNRLEIICFDQHFPALLESIRKENLKTEGFKVEYVVLDNDLSTKPERNERLKDVGYCIEAAPNFQMPSVVYGLCLCQNVWYFGVLTTYNPDWQKHKKKPYSFSNSIGNKTAKSLVSIASKGNESAQLLDACCGVGTIMLEACYSGIRIAGCDPNPKRCHQTRENLRHFHYEAIVHCMDVNNLKGCYDSVIVDLPYNLYSYSNEDITLKIVQSASRLGSRTVIVSIADINSVIEKCGLQITDYCSVGKRGKSGFTRYIWVCESADTYDKSNLSSF
ncbi:MAG: hypothetical protein AAFQ94_06650 [Bacteroidota bacterium]